MKGRGMTPEALRRFALALPESVEEPHFERTSFRTRKRIFATMTRDGLEAMVKLADPDEAEELVSRWPGAFFSHGTWTTRHGALGVRLAAVRTEMMRELVLAAWKALASKRALAAFDADGAAKARRPARGDG